MEKSELENKVLVLQSSPDNLEDEENMNKTTFYQVKQQHIILKD